jgi:predicted alpha/beta hydrolase
LRDASVLSQPHWPRSINRRANFIVMVAIVFLYFQVFARLAFKTLFEVGLFELRALVAELSPTAQMRFIVEHLSHVLHKGSIVR